MAARASFSSGTERAVTAAERSPLARAWQAIGLASAVICGAALLRAPRVVDSIEAAASAHPSQAVGETSNGADAKAGASAGAAAEAPPAPRGASAVELEQARASGVPALSGLAARYPDDPAVVRALLFAQASARLPAADVTATAVRLIELAPASARDPLLVDIVVQAALGPSSSQGAAKALDLLVTKLGPAGYDRLTVIATTSTVSAAARDRAAELLAIPRVRAVGSPAALVAEDLRRAKPCDRKSLFERAGDAGDARALPYLKPLAVTNGCKSGLFGMGGRVDCYPCLGNRAGLNEAIEAIEKRAAATSTSSK